jgi:mRNA-degrading endonuclease RelE of RelBE toxin-antitoxin system
MKFQIRLTPSAEVDLRYFPVHEQRIIVDAASNHLSRDADTPSRRRKKLRPNSLAPWELRVGVYRVFYEVEGESQVKIVAIGHKEHNSLLIRGREVEI